MLIELPKHGRRKPLRIANTAQDYTAFANWPYELGSPVQIGFKPTGNYHRSLAYYLGQQGFALLPSRASRGTVGKRRPGTDIGVLRQLFRLVVPTIYQSLFVQARGALRLD